MTSTFTGKPHNNNISKKLYKSSGIIYHICNNLDIKSKKLVYYSLFHPYLTYCINVWSSTYQTNIKSLNTAQKRSVRSLFATTQEISLQLRKFYSLQNWLNYILAYNMNSGQYLQRNFLTDGHVDCHYQLRNNADLTTTCKYACPEMYPL